MRSLLAFACLAITASAHMQLKQPLPINSKFDTSNTNPDYSMTAPLNGDGSNFPCKGYLNSPGKHVTAQYSAGGQYSIALEGTATHEGGSCQLSLSYDNGATFKVIHSIIGGCPLQAGYNFTMPGGLPAGNNVVFSWTWFNKVGNREMYQNCALVNIQGSGTSQFVAALPAMQVANVGKGCATTEGTEVVFPNPGQSIQFGGSYSNGQISGLSGAGLTGACGTSSGSNTPVVPAPVLTPSQSPLPNTATTTAPAATTTTKAATAVPTGACTGNAIQCLTAYTWAQCANGAYVNMGAVAPGTVCLRGQMVLASPDNVAAAGQAPSSTLGTTRSSVTTTTRSLLRPAPVATAAQTGCRVVKRAYRPECEAFAMRCEQGGLMMCDAGSWQAQGLPCLAERKREVAAGCTGTGIVCVDEGAAFTMCGGGLRIAVPEGTRCMMSGIGGGLVAMDLL